MEYGLKVTPQEALAETEERRFWNEGRYQEAMSHHSNRWEKTLEPERYQAAKQLLECFIGPWQEKPPERPKKKAKKPKKDKKDL